MKFIRVYGAAVLLKIETALTLKEPGPVLYI